MSAGVVAQSFGLDGDASVGDPGHGKRRHDETMRHWITSFQLVAGARTMTERLVHRKKGLREPLLQEILRMAGREIGKLAEHRVAALLVEAQRLVAVAVQHRVEAAALAGQRFRGIHHPAAVPLPPRGLGQP